MKSAQDTTTTVTIQETMAIYIICNNAQSNKVTQWYRGELIKQNVMGESNGCTAARSGSITTEDTGTAKAEKEWQKVEIDTRINDWSREYNNSRQQQQQATAAAGNSSSRRQQQQATAAAGNSSSRQQHQQATAGVVACVPAAQAVHPHLWSRAGSCCHLSRSLSWTCLPRGSPLACTTQSGICGTGHVMVAKIFVLVARIWYELIY